MNNDDKAYGLLFFVLLSFFILGAIQLSGCSSEQSENDTTNKFVILLDDNGNASHVFSVNGRVLYRSEAEITFTDEHDNEIRLLNAYLVIETKMTKDDVMEIYFGTRNDQPWKEGNGKKQ